MKTTVDIADHLLLKAKALAAKRGTTLRAIIEQGLRSVIKEQAPPTAYQLPDLSVGGDGLQPGFRGKSWADFREAAYGDRGG